MVLHAWKDKWYSDVYLFVESLHSHFATCKFFINENVSLILQLYRDSTIQVIILFYLFTKFFQINV